MKWWQGLKSKVIFNEPLKNHTTFKIGGKADFFIEPHDITDLKLLVKKIKQHKIPFFLLGAGSNILVHDKGVRGLVIHLGSPFFKKITAQGNFLQIGSAVTLKALVIAAQRYGFSGAEFLAGIPGSVGGALMMNAGIPGENIGDLIKDITVMDYSGKVKKLKRQDIDFGYRSSNLANYIILSTRIELIKRNKKEIKKEIDGYLQYRRLYQDFSLPSAGCIFKNPRGKNSAGSLIDSCGLKGKRAGGAGISLRHANFIINIKDASAQDVDKLINLARKKVREKFNINLKLEITRWK